MKHDWPATSVLKQLILVASLNQPVDTEIEISITYLEFKILILIISSEKKVTNSKQSFL